MTPTSGNGSRALLLLCLSCFAFGHQLRGADLRGESPSDRLLARWEGGSLSESMFISRYDPSSRALTSGGPLFREAVCKAVYREIYLRRAQDLGLDRSQSFMEDLAVASEQRLGRLFLEVHGPKLSSVDTPRVREYYDAHAATDFTSAGRADLEIVFVRLSQGTDQVEDRRRFERIRRQIENAELSWNAAIVEEGKISGPANGAFQGVGVDRLATELRQAVLRAEIGGRGEVVETDLGLFLVRVTARVPGSVLGFGDVADAIRQRIWREDVAAWKTSAAEALRRESGVPDSVNDDSVFAAAARSEGLDRADAFVSSIREWESWRLADLALFADERVVPSRDRVLDRVGEDSRMRSRYLLYSVNLVVFDAASDHAAAIRGAEDVLQRHATGPVDLMHLADDPLRQVIELTDLHRSDLDRIQRGLEASFTEADIGSVFGPFPVPDAREILLRDSDGGFSRRLDLPSGVVIAILESTRLPAPDDLVREVQRDIRASIASCESLQRWLGPLWHIEILER